MYLITDREAVRSSRLWVGSCRNLPLMTGCTGCKSLGRIIDEDARTFTVRFGKVSIVCVGEMGKRMDGSTISCNQESRVYGRSGTAVPAHQARLVGTSGIERQDENRVGRWQRWQRSGQW